MSIGISPEHRALADSVAGWAAGLGTSRQIRDAEGDPRATFADSWAALAGQGYAAIAIPSELGGGGGSVLDQAVVLEACAAALVPGPLLSTAAASTLLTQVPEIARAVGAGERFSLGLHPTLRVTADRVTGTVQGVLCAASADWLLLGGRDANALETWLAVPAEKVEVRPHEGLDLSRRVAAITVDLPLTETTRLPDVDETLVRRAAVTLAAAEASGVARWCLRTAVEHARRREQFGRPIGSFQAVKHLCAQMLETAEAVRAAAWDVATAAGGDDLQWSFAADVAGCLAFDGAVQVAEDCIQVLGGIGFTFEHDAHLYLRRAVSLRSWLGAGDRDALAVAAQAAAGVRRQVAVDLGGADLPVRPQVRAAVAAVATTPSAERRRALVDAGLLVPHWPAPYGLGADAVTQVVIDEELAAARVERPDLTIGGWALETIVVHGSDAQRERFVGPTLVGDLAWCQLFSEPGAGSDLASLTTRAVRADGGWLLTGQKVWTSHAADADWGICLARTDPDVPKHQGISYFLLDMATPGIDIRPLRELTGDAIFNEVFLDEVFVPDDCVVGAPGDGWRLTRTTLANERVAMGSARLGSSVERAVALVPDVGPTARLHVGRAVALATVCALLGLRGTLRSVAGQGPGAESSVAKLLGVRSRQESAELVVQLLGHRVLVGDPDVDAAVHEMLLSRCLSIAGGTTQILRNVAAERILGLPR